MMGRKRYKWNLNCEMFDESSSKSFYETVDSFRAQFYSIEMIKNFPNFLIGHSKDSNHDPRHDGEDFH